MHECYDDNVYTHTCAWLYSVYTCALCGVPNSTTAPHTVFARTVTTMCDCPETDEQKKKKRKKKCKFVGLSKVINHYCSHGYPQTHLECHFLLCSECVHCSI